MNIRCLKNRHLTLGYNAKQHKISKYTLWLWAPTMGLSMWTKLSSFRYWICRYQISKEMLVVIFRSYICIHNWIYLYLYLSISVSYFIWILIKYTNITNKPYFLSSIPWCKIRSSLKLADINHTVSFYRSTNIWKITFPETLQHIHCPLQKKRIRTFWRTDSKDKQQDTQNVLE